MNNRTLICWYITPPQVSAGAASESAKQWSGKVIFVCDHPLGEIRKRIGWEECSYQNTQIFYLSETNNPEHFVSELVNNNKNAIHLYNGFISKGNIWKLIEKYVMPQSKTPIILASELPGIWGNWYKKLLRILFLGLKNRYIVHKYSHRINALLPYGITGVKKFYSYGWPKDKLFPYMYCPRFNFLQSSIHPFDGIVRFIYIGRFRYSTKGVDVMMKAFDRLKCKNWTLDLVGGHGEQRKQVISWANNNPQVNFKGFCPSHQITELLQNYDVAIVPSRFDGWNPIPNEAAAAGIGTIISDSAVSDEIITASGAGKVFHAGNIDELVKIIEDVINNPDIINIWKKRIIEYRNKISPNTVGKYLNDILCYVTENNSTGKYPICPWLNNEQLNQLNNL